VEGVRDLLAGGAKFATTPESVRWVGEAIFTLVRGATGSTTAAPLFATESVRDALVTMAACATTPESIASIAKATCAVVDGAVSAQRDDLFSGDNVCKAMSGLAGRATIEDCVALATRIVLCCASESRYEMAIIRDAINRFVSARFQLARGESILEKLLDCVAVDAPAQLQGLPLEMLALSILRHVKTTLKGGGVSEQTMVAPLELAENPSQLLPQASKWSLLFDNTSEEAEAAGAWLKDLIRFDNGICSDAVDDAVNSLVWRRHVSVHSGAEDNNHTSADGCCDDAVVTSSVSSYLTSCDVFHNVGGCGAFVWSSSFRLWELLYRCLRSDDAFWDSFEVAFAVFVAQTDPLSPTATIGSSPSASKPQSPVSQNCGPYRHSSLCSPTHKTFATYASNNSMATATLSTASSSRATLQYERFMEGSMFHTSTSKLFLAWQCTNDTDRACRNGPTKTTSKHSSSELNVAHHAPSCRFGEGYYFCFEAAHAARTATPDESGRCALVLFAVYADHVHTVTTRDDYRADEKDVPLHRHGCSVFASNLGDDGQAERSGPPLLRQHHLRSAALFIPVKNYGFTHPCTGQQLPHDVGYQAAGVSCAEFHELVVRSSSRCCPIAIIYFNRND
jgi:hypothetical protein